jgi:hypothetical protein
MRTQALMMAGIVALTAAPALADIPPPDTYVETCTVAQQQGEATECLSCSAYYGDVNRCTRLLEPYCYTKVCKSWGASSWGETLCRMKAKDAPAVPTEITSILTNASNKGPTGSAIDAGMPKTCTPYTPPTTKTVTGTQTSSVTQSSTETKSTTETKTVSSTQSATETKSATSTATTTPTATETKSATSTATTTPTATETKSATNTATTSPTATQSATTTDSGTGTTTQSTPLAVPTNTGPTATGTTSSTATSTSPKTAEDSSGCSVAAGNTAIRALGPLTLVLAGFVLALLRRRSRR